MVPAGDAPPAAPGEKTAPAPTAVRFDDIVDILQTGDLLLFKGEGRISREIELATGSPFSHSAMIIRHGLRATPMIWQAGPTGIELDPVTKVKHGGAQLGDLRETLALMEDPKYHDTAFLRRLTIGRSPDFDDRALQVVAKLDGRPFPSMLGMIEHFVLGRLFHVVANERTLFCSELVALTYMGLGLLPPAPPANSYSPGSFGSKHGSLPLQPPGSLGPEIRIERPTPLPVDPGPGAPG